MTTEQLLTQLVQVTARLTESSECQGQMVEPQNKTLQEGFSTLTDRVETLAG